jgi:hypothetical protein
MHVNANPQLVSQSVGPTKQIRARTTTAFKNDGRKVRLTADGFKNVYHSPPPRAMNLLGGEQEHQSAVRRATP